MSTHPSAMSTLDDTLPLCPPCFRVYLAVLLGTPKRPHKGVM
jgi:hypothetical protein